MNRQWGNTTKNLVTRNIMNVIFLGIGLFIMGESKNMRANIFRNIGNNPATFPWLLGLVITVLAAAVIITESGRILLKVRKEEVHDEPLPGSAFFKKLMLPGVILISAVLFTALVPILGYMIGAILWMVILMQILRTPNKLLTSAIVILLIIITYLVFLWYLPVRLPRGWILFW